MVYDLWDSEAANIIGAFDSEAEALAVVGRALREYGPAYVASLILGRDDDEGESILIATGSDLVERANAFLAATVSTVAAGDVSN